MARLETTSAAIDRSSRDFLPYDVETAGRQRCGYAHAHPPA